MNDWRKVFIKQHIFEFAVKGFDKLNLTARLFIQITGSL